MPLVAEYINKQVLSKLGYRFTTDTLDSWENESYLIIDSEINKEKAIAQKKANKRGRR